jgi:hypothetical protein
MSTMPPADLARTARVWEDAMGHDGNGETVAGYLGINLFALARRAHPSPADIESLGREVILGAFPDGFPQGVGDSWFPRARATVTAMLADLKAQHDENAGQ